MTKEQEQAIKNLESFIDHFQTLIKKADWANDDAFDREQAEQDIKDFKTAIQAIKDLDNALDTIRAEIERKAHSGQWSDATIYGMLKAVAIIDEYRGEA